MNVAYTDWLYTPSYNHPLASGVYLLICLPTGKVYVGSSKDLTRRASQHFRALEEGVHHNRELQYQWDNYGAGSFSFIVLEYIPDIIRLGDREQVWLDRLSHLALNWMRTVSREKPDTGHIIGKADILSWEED